MMIRQAFRGAHHLLAWLACAVVLGTCGFGVERRPGSTSTGSQDADLQGLVVMPTSISVAKQGMPVTVSVHLTKKPADSLDVTATPSMTAKLLVWPGTLTFTAGNYLEPQILVLWAPADSDVMDNTVNLELTAAGDVPPEQIPVDIYTGFN